MKTEPEWQKNTGTVVCPVPEEMLSAGHWSKVQEKVGQIIMSDTAIGKAFVEILRSDGTYGQPNRKMKFKPLHSEEDV